MSSAFILAAATGSSLALASAAHCALMCGPLALAARVRAGRGAAAAYFFGRIVSYALLGAIAGSIGRVLLWSTAARWAEAVLAWLLAASLTMVGFGLLRGRRSGGLIKLGKTPRVSWTGRLLARVSEEPLLLGAATALLPCGALFSAVAASAVLGGALEGALSMISFGMFTGVAVIGVAQLARWSRPGRGFERAVGAVLLIGAGFTLYRPLPALLAGDGVPACHAALAAQGR